MSALARLAEVAGIEPFYHDIWGNRRDTSPETMRALLAAMGLDAGTEDAAAASLTALEGRAWRRMLPPVLVLVEDEPAVIPISTPVDGEGAALTWTLTEEGGAHRCETVPLASLPVLENGTCEGAAYVRRGLALPQVPPLGYHRLEVTLSPGGVGADMVLILSPRRCLTPEEVVPGGRTWGVALQLYGLRGHSDWGMGDFDDLGRFGETMGRLGAGLVGLNPLHALFPADPHHFGPYSPSSRSFLNVLYIDAEAVPDLAESPDARAMIADPAFQERLAAARAAALVDYPAVSALKMPVLEALHRSFRARHLAVDGSARGREFRAFQATMGDALFHHALFDTLHEHFFRQDQALWAWRNWPEPYHHPDSPEVAAFAAEHAERVEFFTYLQWEADRQLGAAAARARGAGVTVGFYRDLAVAGSPGGAAAWAQPGVLVRGASVGAPPDQFNMKGQNWGLAPFSPVGLRDAAYAPFAAMVRANMRHAGALRIDHVMALKHLFWIPDTDGAEGAYVRYPFQDMVRIIALESRRQGCIVIGEDLGTVPEGFRPAMAAAGVLSYRVVYFERTGDGGYVAPGDYPVDSMAVVSTHDLPTFRGFWTGHDLEVRRALDLYPDAAAADKDAWDRGVDRWRLLLALGVQGLKPARYVSDDGAQPFSRELSEAVHRYLGRTTGRIVMMQIEDALGEIEQPNLPGTTDQHPNWRRRLAVAVEDLAGDDGLQAMATAVRRGREEGGG